MEHKIDFEKSFQRLEEIISKMEEKGISLDESIKLHEEGNKIIKELEEEIKLAKEKVEEVIEIK